ILGGFARMQQHALASIAASWKDMYNVEAQLSTVPDRELLAQYQTVADLLTEGADVMSDSADYAGEVRALPTADDRPDDRTTAFGQLLSETLAAVGAVEPERGESVSPPPRSMSLRQLAATGAILVVVSLAMGSLMGQPTAHLPTVAPTAQQLPATAAPAVVR